MKNILFITWDGPQTSYMEGLFLPIFNQIQKQSSYRFHIIQFTWGTKDRIAITQKKATESNVIYTSKKIYRKPNAIIGTMYTILINVVFLEKYIKENAIDIVMPRSTMPSIMINRLKKTTYKILFDADGLPIEERIDFSGLKKKSLLYHFLKKEETLMLTNADTVITRSKKAIKFHLETIGASNRDKFFVVVNGRDVNFFKANVIDSDIIRKELNILTDTKVFIYCGSLGPQYGWETMIKIFKRYLQINHNAIFLILTANTEFAMKRIPHYLQQHIILKSCPFENITKYLSIGDVAFAIRDAKPSMQGVAPIKLGEYLLMGIPTIASSGIGDSDTILSDKSFCFLSEYKTTDIIEKAMYFINQTSEMNREEIREFGKCNFSIESSFTSYIKALNHCS
ncbi:glycosyltransferase [Flavobacterium aquatile]|uniref:glycosyltransferase n=1 Tax=Flavobacterium aquatile TaxID=245 RepID=UPI000B734C6C|nr:glycosyltransferase [Flavobacterium aquatile]OXA67463.1 hypothetical protein B0A61_06480 [Flavobacterium aquatile LMG 4008 = ATCC 11947]GEC79209.1 hypothetical protein FAQ01_20790 [Flavobacterium aquatile]